MCSLLFDLNYFHCADWPRSIFTQKARAFQPINHSARPAVFQSHLFTNQTDGPPLYSSWSKQDATQDETSALENTAIDFFSGDAHSIFDISCCLGSKQEIRKKKVFFFFGICFPSGNVLFYFIFWKESCLHVNVSCILCRGSVDVQNRFWMFNVA